MSAEWVFLARLGLIGAALVGLEVVLIRRQRKRAEEAAKVFWGVGR